MAVRSTVLLICDTFTEVVANDPTGVACMCLETGHFYVKQGANRIQLPSLSESRTYDYIKKNVSLSSLNQDVAVFTGLPALYKLGSLWAFSPSLSLTSAAKIAMWTGPLKTGVALVNSVAVVIAPGELKEFSLTAATNGTLSAPTLYLNNTAAFGVPATCSFLLTLRDLS